LNVDEIGLYMDCPMMFHLKKECEIPNQEYSTIDQKYITELKKVIYFFFNMLVSDTPTSLYHLKKEWEKVWVKRRTKKEVLVPTNNKAIGWNKKKERDGLDVIIKMFDYFNELKFDIVATDTEYVLSYNKGKTISGILPLIIVQNEKTKIIDFRFSNEDFSIKNDIKLTAMSAAYRKYFNDKEESVCIYLLDKGKLIESKRDIEDYKILIRNCKEIDKSIKKNITIRNIGKRCEECQFDILCKGE
jgi:hypothetical protein